MADPLRGYVRQAPITTICVLVIVVLFVAVEVQVARHPAEDSHHVLKQWGRAPELVFLQGDGEPLPELSGPFDLWEGDWWRVPVSAWHHGGTPHEIRLLHLLGSCVLLGYCGWWLEPRLSRFGYLSLIFVTSVVTMLPTYLLGGTAIGMAGVGWALMFFLQQMRRHNTELQARLPAKVFLIAGAILLLLAISESLQLMNLPLLVVGTGVVYGVIAGFLFSKRFRGSRNLRAVFLFSHLAVLLGLARVTNPTWDADYQWYLAIEETEFHAKVDHLHKSVERDPSQVHAWMMLSQLYYREHRLRDAWKTSLLTIDHHRSNEKAVRYTQELWKRFRSKRERERAREILRDVFGNEADSWSERLALRDPPDDWLFFSPLVQKKKTDPEAYSLNQKIELPAEPTPPREPVDSDLLAPAVNPDDPASAAEGIPL